MSSKKQCLIELNISLLIMSATTLFPKLIDLPVNYIIFGRSVIATLVLYLYLKIIKKSSFNFKNKSYLIIVLTGVLMALHWLTLFKAIQIASVSIGIISFFTYPVMTIFLEPLFYKTKLNANDFILSLLVIIGVFFILPNYQLSNSVTQGVLWGLVSALLFALRNIISKGLLKKYSGEEVMMSQSFISAVFILPSIFIFSVGIDIGYPNLMKIIVLGIFFTALPHTLLIRSLKALKPKTVSILSSIQPFYCVLMALLFLNEVPTLQVVFGGGFILSAVAYETYNCRKE